ncbi:MAG: N-acetylglucosamine-6-phosphate deacetylase [Chloroflexota bacterium]
MCWQSAAHAFFPRQELLKPCTILTAGGRIQAVEPDLIPNIPDGYSVGIEADGLLTVPGFIDLQFNGGFGLDFTADPTTIWKVAAQLPRYGVTAFLPTIITSPVETIAQAQDVLRSGPPDGFAGARTLGLHIEGPFLNPGKKGAHNPDHLRSPSPELIADWSPEQFVRLVTLAPELPGALELIPLLASRGVVVSAGHSLATYDEACAGIDAGVRYATHLFNAMPSIHHRTPGLVAAVLGDKRVTIGLIPDGLHVHPALVDLIWRLTGPDRLTLVTDAMAALGMPPGAYELGDYAVTVDEESARLSDGTLAGCVIALDEAIRNFIAFTGCTIPEALATVTATPACLLGMEGKLGAITTGAAADLVLMTPDLRVHTTIIGGRQVFTT